VVTVTQLRGKHAEKAKVERVSIVKEGANMPIFVLEYLLGNYCSSQDEEIVAERLRTVKHILTDNFVRPDESEKIKSLIRERGSYKAIDKVSIELNEKCDVYEAQLLSLGIKGVEVPTKTVRDNEKLLVGGIWALVTLEYCADEGLKTSRFLMKHLKPIQMPNRDMDELRQGRKQFTTEQWLDVLLRSSGMEPANLDTRARWHLLARMIPFVGNIDNVKALLKTSHLLAPFPDAMIDSAFFDRFHSYIPGWEIPKMRPEYFTDQYGFIVDYLAEFFREMRKHNCSPSSRRASMRTPGMPRSRRWGCNSR
jgi:uncharacterized protein (TIGR02653 family)